MNNRRAASEEPAVDTAAPGSAHTRLLDTLVEEGSALGGLPALQPRRRERLNVIVIGAGQAGLSVGYHLARRGVRFVIVDEAKRVGDSWRQRWDSLRLFTPARYDSLDGLPFPAPSFSFPTKDEMAAYLEAYAAHFHLPVRLGVKIDRLCRVDGRYLLEAAGQIFEAEQVVVAMASYQRRRLPAFAAELGPGVVQLHSSQYLNPGQLAPGPVLIAGAGNSGAEIARELVAANPAHRVLLAGPEVGAVPFKTDGIWARLLLTRLVLKVLFHRILTIRTPLGRKARPGFMRKGTPLIRVKPRELLEAGVERVGRVVGVKDGLPLLADGTVARVANVVWCTGFHPGFSWIDLPIFDEHGEPDHRGGVVHAQPGLYFVGLHFLYSVSSTMIHGVGRDAARIAKAVAARARRAGKVPELSQLSRAY